MIKQSVALSWVNLKSFPLRLGGALISMLSIACVTAVMLGVLAFSEGMSKTMARTGLDNTLLVMRAGAISELHSVMFPMEVNLLANHPRVRRDDSEQAIHTAEMFVNAEYRAQYKKGQEQKGSSLALRGIGQQTYGFRPNFQLVAGKLFQPGLREIIVGQAIARRHPELAVGKTITLGNSQWLVSGIFSDQNSVFESEVWADLAMVQSDYQRGNTVQSVRLALQPDTDVEALHREWQADPRLNVRVVLEKDFFANQAQKLTRLVRWVGIPVALLMALGAMIAALNTLYAAIASRSREIATHKAIGFAPAAIFSAILSEALLLALSGGLLGILPVYLVFDGWTAATQNATNLSQMMFNFQVSGSLMVKAMLLSALIGLVGGILPAIKAVRLPVTLALRDT